ncbi:NITA [Symbiodinium sp. CCMP2592]|nr:NITA [Symbiodinium sp. CCMP2592]
MSVSAEEVAKHNTDKDCWVIVGDQVLDVTEFLSEHPGGKKSIMMFAGKDATEEFDMLHDRKVIKKYGLDEVIQRCKCLSLCCALPLDPEPQSQKSPPSQSPEFGKQCPAVPLVCSVCGSSRYDLALIHCLSFCAMSVSAEEVAKHNTDKDCWVIVGDQVLDVTEFLSEHPGGKKSIMMFAGKDATEEFDMLHDRKVIKKYGLDEGTVVLKGTIKK